MIVIPAIDLHKGKCVRLRRGQLEEETVYSDNPVAMAQKWVKAGATRLHVVDLDGAFTGEPHNLDWVLKIKKETKIEIEMGGGLRTMKVIDQVLGAGIDKIILGTVIVEEAGLAKEAFDKYKERIIVGLDAKAGKVAVHGWKDDSGFPVEEAIHIVEKLGAKEVIYTDISRDGMLAGANVQSITDLMKKTPMSIIASGGVADIADIQRLKAAGVPACIVGKAIYEGKLDLHDAIRIASH